MSMTMAELRPALLLVMFEAHNAIPDDQAYSEFDLQNSFLNSDIDATWRNVRLCADDFSDQGLIKLGRPSSPFEQDYSKCSMTAKGIDKAEQLIAPQVLENLGEPDSSGPQTFGFASDSAPFGSGTFAGSDEAVREQALDTKASFDYAPERVPNVEAPLVPAAGRFVSTRDNQSFQNLGRSLNEIRDEFKKDHNKGELGSSDFISEMLGEVDSTLAQIQRGRVRLGQLVDGLDPSLRKVLPYISAYPGLCKIINDALHWIDTIITALG
ncbi:MAG: hypothetical protein ACOH12_16420 [Parvibaculaceae bacterium]